jgi:protein-L-isoaspartate(D-aspartate) O-methyltransferase
MGPGELLDQLRRDIDDERVLEAIAAVPRDVFVPEAERDRAWENRALPIGRGQTISQPLVVGRMCEALAVRAGDRVLDVGTGSGYHAAVLAALGARVWSIERHRPLAVRAARALALAGISGVDVVVGDGMLGHRPAAPYDAISVAATARGDVPRRLLEQLAYGGRLIAPVSGEGAERLVFVRCDANGRLWRTELEPVRFVPLVPGLPDDDG